MEDDIRGNPSGFEPVQEIPLEHRRNLRQILYSDTWRHASRVIREENLRKILDMRRMDVTSTESIAQFYSKQGFTDGVEYVLERLEELTTVEEDSDV